MQEFIDFLEKYESLSLEEIFFLIDKIKDAGDVFILKIDGQRRDGEKYMAIITLPEIPNFTIRSDEKDLRQAIYKVLKKYIQVKSN